MEIKKFKLNPDSISSIEEYKIHGKGYICMIIDNPLFPGYISVTDTKI
jgi:hypothetical protein